MLDRELLLLTAEFSLVKGSTIPLNGVWVGTGSAAQQQATCAPDLLGINPQSLPASNETFREVKQYDGLSNLDDVDMNSIDQSVAASSSEGTGVLSSRRSASPDQEHSHNVHSLFAVRQSPNGVLLPRRQTSIRSVIDGFTVSFSVMDGPYMEEPLTLHDTFDLQPGDLFLHFRTPQPGSVMTVRVWMIVYTSDNPHRKGWKRCYTHPIQHPLFSNRLLGFVVAAPTMPTWVIQNTLRRYQKNQPHLVGHEEDGTESALFTTAQT